MTKTLAIILPFTVAIAMAAIQSQGPDESTTPRTSPRPSPTISGAPGDFPALSAHLAPSREECSKYFDLSATKSNVPDQREQAATLAPRAQAPSVPTPLLAIQYVRVETPAPSPSPSAKPEGEKDAAARADARRLSGAGSSNFFPPKVLRLVSGGYDLPGGGSIRLNVRFDGVTQTFSVETCAKNEAEQWPRFWKTFATSLNSVRGAAEKAELWSRLPIVEADDYNGFNAEYSFAIRFDAQQVITKRIKEMTFLHFNTKNWEWDETQVPVWPTEREGGGPEGANTWPCTWQFN